VGGGSYSLFLAKLRDVRGVMLPVPLVDKQAASQRTLAMWVDEDSCKMFGLQRTPQPVPAGVYRIQERSANFDRGR